jgi:outer membrane protein OmpA-like peptidoglycan-associated protein
MSRPTARAAIIGVLLQGSVALAQPVPELQLERFRFNDGVAGGLSAASGDLLRHGQLSVLAAGSFVSEPLVFFRDGVRLGAPVGDRIGAQLAVAYGVADWLQLSAQLPAVLSQSGEDLRAYGLGNPAASGAGSPFAAARVALVTQGDGGLLGSGAGVDVALQLGAALPFGTADAYATEPGFAVVPQLSAGRSFGRLRLGGELSFVARPQPSEVTLTGYAPTELAGNQLAARAIASTTGDGLRVELSGHYLAALDGGVSGWELLAGARLPFWRLELFALGGPGIGELPGTPAFRVLAGLSLRPPTATSPKPQPPTPEPPPAPEPEPKPGPVAAPAPVPAPPPPAPRVADADADGLDDGDDACPNEPGPLERQGCPVRDSDGDGILDPADACPTEAGPPERKGCPVRDADRDGVIDERDACPAAQGPADNRGCPYTDGDRDGVFDHVDNCPEQPGPADNQGCPAKVKQLVVITADKIVIKDTVYFAYAKAALLPKSFPLLMQIASVLKAHPEIPRLVVEGHTDASGKREPNVRLSQARADSVRAFLVRQGIAAARLAAIGYGPDRPTDDNDTEAGRAKNRRVEFVIDWEAKPAPAAKPAAAKPGVVKPGAKPARPPAAKPLPAKKPQPKKSK